MDDLDLNAQLIDLELLEQINKDAENVANKYDAINPFENKY